MPPPLVAALASLAALLLSVSSAQALALEEGVPPVKKVALLSWESNAAAQGQAPAVAAMVASHLAEAKGLSLITASDITTALGLTRQKALLSPEGAACTDREGCLSEVSGAVGAQYVVTGRLDRFGGRYVLTSSVFDAASARVLAKPRAEAADDAGLPAASQEVAAELMGALGVSAPPAPAAGVTLEGSERTGVSLSLKFGNTFVSSLKALGLGGDFDIGYEVREDWVAFLQIGVTFVRASDEDTVGRLNVLPTVLGVRHLYRVDKSLQPYWGVGLGIQLSFGQFGFLSDSGTLPNIYAILGLQYVFLEHFGVLVDVSTNVAQTILGLTQNGLGGGLNFELNLGLLFRI